MLITKPRGEDYVCAIGWETAMGNAETAEKGIERSWRIDIFDRSLLDDDYDLFTFNCDILGDWEGQHDASHGASVKGTEDGAENRHFDVAENDRKAKLKQENSSRSDDAHLLEGEEMRRRISFRNQICVCHLRRS